MNNNNNWVEDKSMTYFKPCYKIKEVLYSEDSKYQKIEIVKSYQFGKMLLLDGIVQLSQTDEFMYHEMLVHLPLLSLESLPCNIFIAGGGDGCAVKEALKYPSIKEIIWAELDEKVVQACFKYLGIVREEILKDSRVKLNIKEASQELAKYKEYFDAIIIDSTDPVKEAVRLFTKEFYKIAKRALKRDGLIVTQSGSVIFQPSILRNIVNNMQAVFKIAQVYTTIVPTYPGSWWAFTIASDAITPSKLRISKLKEKIKRFNLSFKYYNPKIHSQAFVLPTLLESIIQGELIYGLFKDKKLIWEEEELSLG